MIYLGSPHFEPKSEGTGALRAQVRGSWPADEYVERTGTPRRYPVEHSSDNGSSGYTMLPVAFSSDSIYGTECRDAEKRGSLPNLSAMSPEDGALYIPNGYENRKSK